MSFVFKSVAVFGKPYHIQGMYRNDYEKGLKV